MNLPGSEVQVVTTLTFCDRRQQVGVANSSVIVSRTT